MDPPSNPPSHYITLRKIPVFFAIFATATNDKRRLRLLLVNIVQQIYRERSLVHSRFVKPGKIQTQFRPHDQKMEMNMIIIMVPFVVEDDHVQIMSRNMLLLRLNIPGCLKTIVKMTAT